jgi:predicted nuclease with RNAse H fold
MSNQATTLNYRRWAGIDLGGRTTGKTALAWMEFDTTLVHILSASTLKTLCGSSDQLFLDLLNSYHFDVVGFDAPLSLPDCTQPDYLFRPGDRQVGALSPFSVGELTARAIYLSHHLGSHAIEVYPKTVLQMLDLPHRGYKSETDVLGQRAEFIASLYGWTMTEIPSDSDTFDAFLALVSVWHYVSDRYLNIGTQPQPFIVPVNPPRRRD